MPAQEATNASLIHHYSHVVNALTVSLAQMPKTSYGEGKDAIETSIRNVCGLIDRLVAAEKKDN